MAHQTEKRADGFTYCRCGLRAWDPTFLDEMPCTATPSALSDEMVSAFLDEPDFHIVHSRPEAPIVGRLWFDQQQDKLFAFTDLGWEDPATPGAGPFGTPPLIPTPVPWAKVLVATQSVSDETLAADSRSVVYNAIADNFTKDLRKMLAEERMLPVTAAEVTNTPVPVAGMTRFRASLYAVPWPPAHPINVEDRLRGLWPGHWTAPPARFLTRAEAFGPPSE